METGTENKHLVAAYGTLRKGFANSRYVDQPNNNWLGEGITKEKYTMFAAGIPFVNKTPTVNIVVDVWEIDDRSLRNVDGLEGHPKWYKRELIPIIIDGEEKMCWLYFNNETRGSMVESGDFKNR